MKDRLDLTLNFVVGKGGTGKSLFAELLYDSMQMSGRSEAIELFSNLFSFSHVIPSRRFMTLDRLGHNVQNIPAKEAIWELATVDLDALSEQYETYQFSNAEWISLGLQIRFWLMISSDYASLWVAAKIINQFSHRANFALVINNDTTEAELFWGSREALIDLFKSRGWTDFVSEQQQITEEEALNFLQSVPIVHLPYLPMTLRKLTNYTPERPTIRSLSGNSTTMNQSRAKRFLEKANTEILAVL